MANALLVSYAGYPFTPSSLCPDNGLALLAAVLRGAGHRTRVVDFGTLETMRRLYPEAQSGRAAPLLLELAGSGGQPEPGLIAQIASLETELEAHRGHELLALAEELIAQVTEVQPAFVGFKLWNGDGFSGSVALAEALKRRFPSLPIYAGGPHATWCAAAILERTGAFDAIIVGEAEDKIVPLMDAACGLRPVEGIAGVVTATCPDGRPTFDVDLADLPAGDYDLDTYPTMAGDQKLKLLVVDDSRGCPFGCAFCTHPVESGRRLRTRPAELIVQDMAGLAQQGIGAFRFAGSSTPGSLMAQVADGLLQGDLHVRYTTFAHFASSAPDHFGRMRASGLEAMFFGLETGSAELLRKAAGKPIKLEDIAQTVQAARDAGIAVVCSMIVPMPFETEETFQESLRLLLEIRPDAVPVQFPGLLPGTPWFENPGAYNFEVDIPRYVRENMDYKIKLLFPPAFWQPLPYRLNGMDFAQFTALTGRFAATLEANGILTGMPDDNLLMASIAGIPPRQFRDLARLWCASGDVGALARFVSTFNRNAAPGAGQPA